MKIYKKSQIPKWYDLDSSLRSIELVNQRIRDIKQVDKEFNTRSNIRIQKQNNETEIENVFISFININFNETKDIIQRKP